MEKRYDVFISYSSDDQKIAEGICGYLERMDYRCFVAYRDIPRGVVWAAAITNAIDDSAMMVVVFSNAFNISPQTDREIELASENRMPILTYRIADDKMTGAKKYYLKNLHWIDAFPNPENYFGQLLDSVVKLIGDKRKEEETAERKQIEPKQRTKPPQSSQSKKSTNSFNGHEYVDLGLPSGTLWATCNVGANKPEEYGDYFAWGEIKQKTVYDWNTYEYSSKVKQRKFKKVDLLTKYCNKSAYGYEGFTDELTVLQSADDPATTNWGNGWEMPSKEQWEELKENTKSTWTTRNGVKGRLFTANNGNSLFLPAAGYRWVDVLLDAGSYGDYWSSSLYTGDPSGAWYFDFGSGGYDVSSGSRSHGFTVRPVRSARQN